MCNKQCHDYRNTARCKQRTASPYFLVAFFFATTFVNPSEGQTLGQALNATNLTWTTSGTAGATGWLSETNRTHDGVSAAESSTLYFNFQTSVLQTTVTGPGTLSFWWSNASLNNRLSFSAGGANLTSIIAYPSWQQQTIYLGSGSQTLQWVYAFSSSDGVRSYVDEVSYTPGASAPVITSQPLSQSHVPGFSTTFKVGARGTPPLAWQWHFNGQDISGATNNSLTILSVQATNLGNYAVTVSNSVGSVLSSNASLEFGQVTAWGENGYGATMTPPGATNILGLAAGNYFSLALKGDGTILAWGNDAQGQVTEAGNISNAVAVAATGGNCLALEADGTVIAWGNNSANVPIDLTNAVAIAAGMFHNTALTSDGRVVTWGYLNDTNQPPDLTNAAAITAGDLNVSLALKADGTTVAWGSSPALPANLSNIVALAAGGPHYMALRDDGTVICWGDNTYGEATTPPGLRNVVAISAGDLYSAALLADGTVTAWGTSIGGVTNPPAGLTNVNSLAAGYFHSVALVGPGPPVSTAFINNPQLSSSGFSVSIPSQSGHVYGLEYKHALDEVAWTRLPLVAGTGKSLSLYDAAIAGGQRFYRVRRW